MSSVFTPEGHHLTFSIPLTSEPKSSYTLDFKKEEKEEGNYNTEAQEYLRDASRSWCLCNTFAVGQKTKSLAYYVLKIVVEQGVADLLPQPPPPTTTIICQLMSQTN